MKPLTELGISPAPWLLDAQPYGSWITDQRGRYLSSDDGEFPNPSDARLIAAAPELYEALQFINEHIAFSAMGGGADVVDEARRKMIAALAKASGESEVAK